MCGTDKFDLSVDNDVAIVDTGYALDMRSTQRYQTRTTQDQAQVFYCCQRFL